MDNNNEFGVSGEENEEPVPEVGAGKDQLPVLAAQQMRKRG